MRIISVPSRLKAISALLFLSIPLAVLQAVVVMKAPWWRLPYQSLAIVGATALLVSAPIAFGVLRARKWALGGAFFFGAAWAIGSLLGALKAQSPSLGFVSLAVIGFVSALLMLLNRELSRSFLDPGIRWYHGLPKPVPGLGCELMKGDGKVSLRVSRLDRDGVFLFDESGSAEWGTEPVRLVLHFKSREVLCSAVPMAFLERGAGAGFQFSGMSPDSRKELGDLIEFLRGEGYVE